MTELEEIKRRIELKLQFLQLLEDERGKIVREILSMLKQEKILQDAES